MRNLKIVLSVLFVVMVTFLVVRGCVQKRRVFAPHRQEVLAPSRKKRIPVVPLEKTAQPRVAIILDDWGNNFPLFDQALAVGRPLTLSILPNLPHSKRIAEAAFSHGLGVMLHMPMQPENPKEKLEPQTILTTSSEADIIRYLDEALLSIPHVEGANNHMGSAATRDKRVMGIFLTALKKRGLFFVDSNVVQDTQGVSIAKSMGIPFAKREVFLDNEPDPAKIRKQLLRAKKLALSKGKVVVIGHDKKLTLEAIKEMVPEFEREGVRFVLVKELLE